jgi:hypothetical protein
LVKFPVALSGGSSEKVAPLPSWMLLTVPTKLRFGTESIRISDRDANRAKGAVFYPVEQFRADQDAFE